MIWSFYKQMMLIKSKFSSKSDVWNLKKKDIKHDLQSAILATVAGSLIVTNLNMYYKKNLAVKLFFIDSVLSQKYGCFGAYYVYFWPRVKIWQVPDWPMIFIPTSPIRMLLYEKLCPVFSCKIHICKSKVSKTKKEQYKMLNNIIYF